MSPRSLFSVVNAPARLLLCNCAPPAPPSRLCRIPTGRASLDLDVAPASGWLEKQEEGGRKKVGTSRLTSPRIVSEMFGKHMN
jgi:hypothetical protein